MNKKSSKTLLAALALAASFGCATQSAFAGATPDLDPDLTANVWTENDVQYASVILNGKELLTYKANSDDTTAEAKAEDLADKLKTIIGKDKFDATKLLPAKEGEVAVVRIDGTTVFKFDTPESVDGKKVSSPLEQSFKVVNSLRSALGVALLPSSFLKVADFVKNAPIAIKNSGASCFSGAASWYGGKFNGRKTSDGTTFDQDGLTAAHRSLPFGTKLLVTNRSTGDQCIVQVNDRGPFIDGRIIDLSRGAARQLNMLGSGVAMVDCQVIED